jgi:hypothetical protein
MKNNNKLKKYLLLGCSIKLLSKPPWDMFLTSWRKEKKKEGTRKERKISRVHQK